MRIFSVLLLAAACAASASAERLTFYIGRDAHANLNYYHHANNDYVGMANPNYNRLTFLYAHWIQPPLPVQANHHHGRSNYFYEGDPGSAVVVSEQADNVIPELYTGFPGLLMREETTGPFAGKLTSHVYDDTSEETGEEGHYSDLRMASVHELDGFAPTEAEYWMRYGNRGKVGGPDGESDTVGRYSGVLDGSLVALTLVSASPGLHVGVDSNIDIFDSSSTYTLGAGEDFRFEPVFWTEPDAPLGTYTASFMLTDLNSSTTGILDSGVFSFEVRVVPEPASLALLAFLGPATLIAGRKRNLV